MSGAYARRSIARSGATRSRPCAESGIALSVRSRLTLVFAAAMAAVLAGVAVFVYGRVHADLRGAVDMGLRSRAQVIAANASRAGTKIGGGPHSSRLIDPDEAF